MPSSFDTEFQSLVVPDVLDTFGEDATFTPRDTHNAAYAIVAIWQLPRGERDQEGTVELDSRRWEIIVRKSDLVFETEKGDRLSRVVGGVTKTYRLVSDAIAPHEQDDDSGGAFGKLSAVEVFA